MQFQSLKLWEFSKKGMVLHMYRAFALMLLVDDVNKAVAWYQDILGAKLQRARNTACRRLLLSNGLRSYLAILNLCFRVKSQPNSGMGFRFLKNRPILLYTSMSRMPIFYTARLKTRPGSLWSLRTSRMGSVSSPFKTLSDSS